MIGRGLMFVLASLGCGRVGFTPGPDASTDAAAPFCDVHANAQLCDDFDAPGATLPQPWDAQQLQDGTITIDSQQSLSAPSSLLSVVPGGAANNNRNYLTRQLAPASSLRIAADLMVEHVSTSGFAELLKITLLPPPANFIEYNCAVNVGPSGTLNLSFYANPTSGSSTFPWAAVPVTPSPWARLELEIELAASPRCMLYDGNGALLASLDTLPVTSLGAAAQIGIVDAYSPSGPIVDTWQVRHDNVVVTRVP